jgi:hypothetical protein
LGNVPEVLIKKAINLRQQKTINPMFFKNNNFDDLNKNKKTIFIVNIILVIAIVVSFFGFVRDINNTIYYGGVDLRSNVIGARLLLEDKDPYYYVWKEGDSDLLLHPTVSPNLPVGHVTVSPTVLFVYTSTAWLPYGVQQNIWFLLQWIFLLLSIYIFARASKSEIKSKLIWILGLLFISGSFMWRLHVERSKIIIFYGFLVAVAFLIYNMSFKHKDLIAGIFIGFTAALRFPYILMGIPFLIFKKWKIIAGMAIGLLIGIALPMIFTKPEIWVNYFTAMQVQGKIHSGEIQVAEFEYIRRTIEGMDNLYLYAVIPAVDFSIQTLFVFLMGIALSTNILIISLLVILSVIVFLLYKYHIKKIDPGMIFLLGMVLVYLCELFIPAVRWSYYDVIFVNILLLIILNMNFVSDIVNPFLIFLVLGFLSNVLYFKAFSISLLIGSAAMLVYVISMTFVLYKGKKSRDRLEAGLAINQL